MPKYEHLNYQGAGKHNIKDFKEVDILLVDSDPLFYSSLFRFLTLLIREYDITLVLPPEMEEVASTTGFSNLI